MTAMVEPGSDRQTASPQEVAERLRQGEGVLVDVRTPAEFRSVHAEGAVSKPLDALDPEQVVREHGGDGKPLFLICRSGNRSMMALQRFLEQGIGEVISVEGGTQAWDASGLPVVRGRQTISLDRQMRISAGALVVLGVVAGAVWHPAGYVLAGCIGAGLVFAGVTDTCPMSSMLARAPWNR